MDKGSKDSSSSSSDGSALDSSHPLFLNASDTQATTIVTQVLRGSENYDVWSRSMKIALSAKNKWGLIDGSCVRDPKQQSLQDLWDRCNTVVLSWLINSVDKSIATGIVFASSARAVWQELEDRFHKPDGTRIFSLHKAISTLTQGALTVSEYFTKMKDLWDKYDSLVPFPSCQCPTTKEYSRINQEQRLLQFLLGLNDNHHQARTQILLQTPLPTVNQAYSLISQDESRRLISSSSRTFHNVGITMTMREGRIGRGQGRGQSVDECTYWHRRGHKRDACYHLIGFSPSFKGKSSQDSIINNLSGNSSGRTREELSTTVPQDKNFSPPFTKEQYDEIFRILGREPTQVNVERVECPDDIVAETFSEDLGKSLSSLKILSYNVWFREDLKVHRRMNAIGDLIQHHNPDLIFFQEVTPNIYDIFKETSWWNVYRCSVSLNKAYSRKYFSMVLSKLPVKSFSTVPFSNSIMGRELCIAEIEFMNGKPFAVATSHLEGPCPAPPKWVQMYSKERVEQAREAMNVLCKYPNVIFGGDMNWDDELDGQFPFQDGWIDAWSQLRPNENGWTYDTKSNQMLAGNRPLQKRLDRFICSLQDFKISSIDMVGMNEIPGVSYIKEKKVREETKQLVLPVLPSDHYGLLLTISIK